MKSKNYNINYNNKVFIPLENSSNDEVSNGTISIVFKKIIFSGEITKVVIFNINF